MKIDLCKLFGVEEREEFKIKVKVTEKYEVINKYRFKNGNLEFYNDCIDKWEDSAIEFNTVLNSEIIKLPERKKFTDDELCILRNIDKKYKWIARDKVNKDEVNKYGNLNIYIGKPYEDTISWLPSDVYCELHEYNHLFQSIKWEDEEPVCIDDYVERK